MLRSEITLNPDTAKPGRWSSALVGDERFYQRIICANPLQKKKKKKKKKKKTCLKGNASSFRYEHSMHTGVLLLLGIPHRTFCNKPVEIFLSSINFPLQELLCCTPMYKRTIMLKCEGTRFVLYHPKPSHTALVQCYSCQLASSQFILVLLSICSLS